MLNKFVVECWIREKFSYFQSDLRIGDPEQFYFDNHENFLFDDEFRSYPVKKWNYLDSNSEVNLKGILGYDQIGAEFTIVDNKELTTDRVDLFRTALKRAIEAYKNFKAVLEEKFPNNIKIEFEWQPNLLVLTYGFFEGLTKKEKENLLTNLNTGLQDFTCDPTFIVVNKELYNPTANRKIRSYSMEEMEKCEELDFNSMFVFFGPVDIFINHHLFATQFFLDDPSISAVTVAERSLFAAIKLQSIHFEMEQYSKAWNKLKSDLEKESTTLIKTGLGSLKKKLVELQKFQNILEYDLSEFTNLGNKIIEGIIENDLKHEIYQSLFHMKSLPSSLPYAKEILELKALDLFSNFKHEMFDLETDLEKLEINSRSQEIFIIAIAFVILIVIAVPITVWDPHLTSNIANFLQILTFGVALTLLLLRYFPRK